MKDPFIILIKIISITYDHARRERVLGVQLRVWVLGVVLSINSFAGKVERYGHISQSSSPKCDDCRVTKFKTETYHYKAYLPEGVSHGTGMYTSFETKDANSLKDYVIVQFIKGCHFESKIENNQITKRLTRSRYFFNDLVKYKHSEWVIDSIDADPVYSSTPKGRHFSYRWNLNPLSYNSDTEFLYGRRFPENPRLYISDFPGTAFKISDSEAINISLKFKTCLFRSVDIPRNSTPAVENIDMKQALSCHSWSSSHLYNHKKDLYESSQKIDSFCEN